MRSMELTANVWYATKNFRNVWHATKRKKSNIKAIHAPLRTLFLIWIPRWPLPLSCWHYPHWRNTSYPAYSLLIHALISEFASTISCTLQEHRIS
jgi:hypothetical protein